MGNPKKAKAKVPVSSKKKSSKKKAGREAAAAEHRAVDDGTEAGPSVPTVWRPGAPFHVISLLQREGQQDAKLLCLARWSPEIAGQVVETDDAMGRAGLRRLVSSCVQTLMCAPGVDDVEEGEELQYDPTAYDCMHIMSLDWPCLRCGATRPLIRSPVSSTTMCIVLPMHQSALPGMRHEDFASLHMPGNSSGGHYTSNIIPVASLSTNNTSAVSVCTCCYTLTSCCCANMSWESATTPTQCLTGNVCMRSFDIIRDELGGPRSTFPHTLTIAAGTQAAHARQNAIALVKLANLGQGKHGAKVGSLLVHRSQQSFGDELGECASRKVDWMWECGRCFMRVQCRRTEGKATRVPQRPVGLD